MYNFLALPCRYLKYLTRSSLLKCLLLTKISLWYYFIISFLNLLSFINSISYSYDSSSRTKIKLSNEPSYSIFTSGSFYFFTDFTTFDTGACLSLILTLMSEYSLFKFLRYELKNSLICLLFEEGELELLLLFMLLECFLGSLILFMIYLVLYSLKDGLLFFISYMDSCLETPVDVIFSTLFVLFFAICSLFISPEVELTLFWFDSFLFLIWLYLCA